MARPRRQCERGTCGSRCGGGGCSYARLPDEVDQFLAVKFGRVPLDLGPEVLARLQDAISGINSILDPVRHDFKEKLPSHKLAFLENDSGRLTLGFVRVEGPDTDIELDLPDSNT